MPQQENILKRNMSGEDGSQDSAKVPPGLEPSPRSVLGEGVLLEGRAALGDDDPPAESDEHDIAKFKSSSARDAVAADVSGETILNENPPNGAIICGEERQAKLVLEKPESAVEENETGASTAAEEKRADSQPGRETLISADSNTSPCPSGGSDDAVKLETTKKSSLASSAASEDSPQQKPERSRGSRSVAFADGLTGEEDDWVKNEERMRAKKAEESLRRKLMMTSDSQPSLEEDTSGLSAVRLRKSPVNVAEYSGGDISGSRQKSSSGDFSVQAMKRMMRDNARGDSSSSELKSSRNSSKTLTGSSADAALIDANIRKMQLRLLDATEERSGRARSLESESYSGHWNSSSNRRADSMEETSARSVASQSDVTHALARYAQKPPTRSDSNDASSTDDRISTSSTGQKSSASSGKHTKKLVPCESHQEVNVPRHRSHNMKSPSGSVANGKASSAQVEGRNMHRSSIVGRGKKRVISHDPVKVNETSNSIGGRDTTAPDTPPVSPDGKPYTGRKLGFADEFGDDLVVTSYSEKLHYSSQYIDDDALQRCQCRIS
jgi:hypothetical protein